MEENNKTLDKFVGHKIRERRKSIGLTQAELAEILHLSHQQVQRYEAGDNTVSTPRLLEIANVLNVKPSYFFDDAPLGKAAAPKNANGIISRNSERPLHLLLVEDSSSDEILFRKATEKSPVAVEIHTIQNPDQVLDFLQNHHEKYGQPMPDIILLDINMPRTSGLQILAEIKNNKAFQMMPVIMLTNSVRAKDMREAYANHANGFIQKNSDLMEFYEDINRILQYWGRTVVLPNAA